MKIFISYHHEREQEHKNLLAKLFEVYSEYFPFKDISVKKGDITPKAPDLVVHKIIWNNHLKYAKITIVILGQDTGCRRYVDWEIAHSLKRSGSLNSRERSGLIVLLTDDFIKRAESNEVSNNDYNCLVTQENSSERIYQNVKNGYALVESFSNICLNPSKLKKMINESGIISKKIIPFNESIFKTDIIKTNNEKPCFNKISQHKINKLVDNITKPITKHKPSIN